MIEIFSTVFRKLGESEAQCNTLREEVKQHKAEIEQLKVGGKSASMFYDICLKLKSQIVSLLCPKVINI